MTKNASTISNKRHRSRTLKTVEILAVDADFSADINLLVTYLRKCTWLSVVGNQNLL